MKKLILPSLRAHMGDWVYYITFMRMEDIANNVKMVAEIHQSKRLAEWIQREITGRSSEIALYLQNQKQRFFNSIIIGVYGGSPQWFELSINRNKKLDVDSLPEYIEGALGILTLEGTEKLFAIDGQHRVAALQEAVKKNKKIKDEEISVIFIAHKKDSAGMERTRRLFTTLNRYAKPVNLMEIIALDEDDGIAITTRELLDRYNLFSDNTILIKKGKSIPSTDTKSLTTIIVLYEMLDLILFDICPLLKSVKNKKLFKAFRPDEETLKQMYNQAKNFWDLITKYFKPLNELKAAKQKDDIVKKYRNKEGGNLLYRPIGLLSITRAIARSKKCEYDIEGTIKRIALLDFELTKEPWIGLLWDNTGKKVITRKENQEIASDLIIYMIKYKIERFGISLTKLKTDYAGKINKPVEQVNLPNQLTIQEI